MNLLNAHQNRYSSAGLRLCSPFKNIRTLHNVSSLVLAASKTVKSAVQGPSEVQGPMQLPELHWPRLGLALSLISVPPPHLSDFPLLLCLHFSPHPPPTCALLQLTCHQPQCACQASRLARKEAARELWTSSATIGLLALKEQEGWQRAREKVRKQASATCYSIPSAQLASGGGIKGQLIQGRQINIGGSEQAFLKPLLQGGGHGF